MKSKRDEAPLCADCGNDYGIGHVIRGKVYCRKCYEIIKGLRDKTGKYVGPTNSKPSNCYAYILGG